MTEPSTSSAPKCSYCNDKGHNTRCYDEIGSEDFGGEGYAKRGLIEKVTCKKCQKEAPSGGEVRLAANGVSSSPSDRASSSLGKEAPDTDLAKDINDGLDRQYNDTPLLLGEWAPKCDCCGWDDAGYKCEPTCASLAPLPLGKEAPSGDSASSSTAGRARNGGMESTSLDQSKKALEKSITLGSKVWKDIPDAGKYVREKRDQKAAPSTLQAKLEACERENKIMQEALEILSQTKERTGSGHLVRTSDAKFAHETLYRTQSLPEHKGFASSPGQRGELTPEDKKSIDEAKKLVPIRHSLPTPMTEPSTPSALKSTGGFPSAPMCRQWEDMIAACERENAKNKSNEAIDKLYAKMCELDTPKRGELRAFLTLLLP